MQWLTLSYHLLLLTHYWILSPSPPRIVEIHKDLYLSSLMQDLCCLIIVSYFFCLWSPADPLLDTWHHSFTFSHAKSLQSDHNAIVFLIVITCRSAPRHLASSKITNASRSEIGELWRGKQRRLRSSTTWVNVCMCVLMCVLVRVRVVVLKLESCKEEEGRKRKKEEEEGSSAG